MQNEITEAESITGRRQKNNKNKAITKNRDQPIHSNINIKEEIKKTASKGCRQWRRWWSGSPTPRIESSGAWTTPEKTEPTPARRDWHRDEKLWRVRVRGCGWEWEVAGESGKAAVGRRRRRRRRRRLKGRVHHGVVIGRRCCHPFSREICARSNLDLIMNDV